jgi:hypothetical protein
VICHKNSGEIYFDSCSYDGVEVVTATPAADNSLTTITSDADALCVSCTQSGTGDETGWTSRGRSRHFYTTIDCHRLSLAVIP